MPYGGFYDLDLTEDFERFLEGAQGSEPVGSRCAEVAHCDNQKSVQHLLDQDFCVTDESMDDLSDLCFQELGDFSLSDLNISAEMMDYLLG